MNLNVFQSSRATRYVIGTSGEGPFDDSFDASFQYTVEVATGAFESDGNFDRNKFESNSTTRYEVTEAVEFDYELDFEF